jgi:hypothetical protein
LGFSKEAQFLSAPALGVVFLTIGGDIINDAYIGGALDKTFELTL